MSAAVSTNAVAGRIPPAPFLQLLSRHRREDIEAFIAISIDLLDLVDGDADLEGAHDEDEISTAFFLMARCEPGCPISDPGGQHDEDDINTLLVAATSVTPGCILSDDDIDEGMV